ncbi:hypothetical protein [Agriterribacter humi]|uniref:hypothetical protein n=1 Tax=Agriterribacter humi TaxID=1104781 RepID=UPI001264EC54|nr:hypothetical protein [Agriterribacter humi]
MKIHIGEVIKKFAKTVKIDNMDTFCMERLNMTKQNYYRAIKQESMNTDMLVTFCSAFNHDFFQYYYNFEPLKSIGKVELKRLKEDNIELNLAIERKEDLLKDYERKIVLLKEENSQLKERNSLSKNSSRQKKK